MISLAENAEQHCIELAECKAKPGECWAAFEFINARNNLFSLDGGPIHGHAFINTDVDAENPDAIDWQGEGNLYCRFPLRLEAPDEQFKSRPARQHRGQAGGNSFRDQWFSNDSLGQNRRF